MTTGGPNANQGNEGQLSILDITPWAASLISLIQKYHIRQSDVTILDLHGNGLVVAHIGQDLYLPEHYGEILGGDGILPSARDRAADIIFWSILRSNDFPAATRAWVNDKKVFSSGDTWPLIFDLRLVGT